MFECEALAGFPETKDALRPEHAHPIDLEHVHARQHCHTYTHARTHAHLWYEKGDEKFLQNSHKDLYKHKAIGNT